MADLLSAPYSYFADANGAPLNAGKVFSYAAGTTTPKDTYTDSSGVTPATNPVILDAAGRAAIWLSGAYKITVTDSLGNVIRTVDNISAQGAAGDMTKLVYDPADIEEQLVGLTASQTLTNKTLTAPQITGAVTGTFSLPSGATATTQSPGDNSTKLATTAYVATYAPLASPALTGNPTAPTQAPGDNSTKLATTAYSDAGGIMAALAVKSFVMAYVSTGTPTIAPGTTSAGSLMTPVTSDLITGAWTTTGDTLSGTWQASSSTNRVQLWQRIA